MTAKRFGLREVSSHFGLFDFKVVCISGPYTRVEEYVRWKFEDPHFRVDCPYEPRGRIFYRPGFVPIIWIPRKPRTPREHGTLAHEVLHAVSLLMAWSATDFNGSTEEVWCHAVGFLVTDLLTKLR